MKFLALLLCVFAGTVAAGPKTQNFKSDICSLPPYAGEIERGHSLKYEWRFHYSYSKETNRCFSFIYTGSGGNANRFPTLQQCEEACKTSTN